MADPRTFDTLADLRAAEGEAVGHSDWERIDQARIDAFADATGDHQWIHVEPERAANGPFGTTIAHGYLTLSLLPMLAGQVVDYRGWTTKINYGANKVRFPQPVPVDAHVRASVRVDSVAAGEESDFVQVTSTVTVEVWPAGSDEPGQKPAVVAETVTMLAGPTA